MFVPLGNFGKYGVVSDTLNSALPIGTWTDARNMRFSGIQMEKMLEPTLVAPLVDEDDNALADVQWMQAFDDGLTSYVVVAAATQLWILRRGAEDDVGFFIDVSRTTGSYSPDGQWDSFAWGDTCIFNNGIDAPQIYDAGEQAFVDLPGWGFISSGDDISAGADPSIDTNASCRVLKPFRNFLVACGVTERGKYQPNAVWVSDATSLAGFDPGAVAGGGPPSWDYESPATLSGKFEVGAGSGAISCAVGLNENMVIYTEGSATIMQYVAGSSLVMSFRRLFGKGAAGARCVTEFSNRHFVVSRDELYVHDGSVPLPVAEDRVEEEFYRRVGKGGRFGGGDVDWEALQVLVDPDRKEVICAFTDPDGVREALHWNFSEDNYTWADASVGTLIPGTPTGGNAAAVAPGAVVCLDFEDINPSYPASPANDFARVASFYNGGTSNKGTSGPNYGVDFNIQALALSLEDETHHPDSSNTSRGGQGDPTSQRGGVFFLTGDFTYLTVPAGFDTGLSLYYSAINQPGAVQIYDGEDGTGSILATLLLPTTPSLPPAGYDAAFVPFYAASVAFSGVAKSVDFFGTINQIIFDDITFGSLTPGTPPMVPGVPTYGLDPAVCMKYQPAPGWQVTWDDLDAAGTTWDDLTTDGTAWNDLYSGRAERNLYWLTANGLYAADQYVETEGGKQYFVERRNIDLNDVVEQFTTSRWIYAKQMYLHLASQIAADNTDVNEFDIQVGWSDTLMDEPDWLPLTTINLQTRANGGKVKYDFRSTGRYLALRFYFNRTGPIQMTGAEIDVAQTHGR